MNSWIRIVQFTYFLKVLLRFMFTCREFYSLSEVVIRRKQAYVKLFNKRSENTGTAMLLSKD